MAQYKTSLIKTDRTRSTCIESRSGNFKLKPSRQSQELSIDVSDSKISLKQSPTEDLVFVNGIEVETARSCGNLTFPFATNVKNCFSFKKPRIVVDSTVSTPALLKLTFGSMPSNGNQISITANGATNTVTFTNSGGTAGVFSSNAANIDITATTTVNAVAAAMQTLFDTLSGYSSSNLGNFVTIFSDVVMTTTYDITLNTNTSPATAENTAGKHLVLYPSDSGALVVFTTRNAMVLLPDSGISSNLGCSYTFMSLTSTGTQGQKILCADTANEKIYGALMGIDIDSSPNAVNTYSAASGNNYSAILWNGTTTGAANSYVTLTAIATDQWAATSGVIYQTGTPATPFLTS